MVIEKLLAVCGTVILLAIITAISIYNIIIDAAEVEFRKEAVKAGLEEQRTEGYTHPLWAYPKGK